MKQHNMTLWLAACGALLALLTGCRTTAPRDLTQQPKIGVVLPLSGIYAEYGRQILAGVKCGRAMLEQEYGSDTLMPELIVIDDAGSPAKADQAVRKLAADGAATALVGYTSQEALGVKTAALELNFPVLTPAGSNDQITERNPYMFRVNFSDRTQAKALAYYAYFIEGKRRLASLINLDENAIYSRDLGRQAAQFFADYGGQVIASGGFREEDKDFRPLLQEILADVPDVVFVPAYADAGGRMVAQLRELGYRGLILGGDGWLGTDFLKQCGPNPEPAAFAASYVTEIDLPEQRAFIKLFKEQNHYEPGVNEALGYDAIRVAFMATRQTEDVDAVLKRMEQIRSYAGACGNIRIMRDGNVRRTVYINDVKSSPDGKKSFHLSKSISPNQIDRLVEDFNVKRK